MKKKQLAALVKELKERNEKNEKRLASALQNRTYDFLTTKGRRKDRGSTIKAQHEELDHNKRNKAINTARDMYNNVIECYWAVNRYVNAVTGFTFQPTTKDRELAQRLIDFYERFNETADVTGRYTYNELLRLWELRQIIDGDVLKIRLMSGQIETIHADWIQTGNQPANENWIDGVRVDEYGKPIAYSIIRQTAKGKEVKRIIDARHAYLKFHSDGRIDSYRGVSPLVSALAEFQDVKEIKTYTNTKVKLESILALAIKRTSGKYDYGYQVGDYALGSSGVPITDAVAGEPDSGTGSVGTSSVITDPTLSADDELNRNFELPDAETGAAIVDTIGDETVSNITNQTPSSSFKDFYDMSVKTAYKALDIPGSFADESLSNYNSMRCASMQFEDSTEAEVEKNGKEITSDLVWAMRLAVANGQLQLPAGVEPSAKLFKLIHKRRRIIDADREFKSFGIGVSNGFWSFEDTCNMLGKDAYDVIDSNAKIMEYARNKGVSLPCITPIGQEGNNATDAE